MGCGASSVQNAGQTPLVKVADGAPEGELGFLKPEAADAALMKLKHNVTSDDLDTDEPEESRPSTSTSTMADSDLNRAGAESPAEEPAAGPPSPCKRRSGSKCSSRASSGDGGVEELAEASLLGAVADSTMPPPPPAAPALREERKKTPEEPARAEPPQQKEPEVNEASSATQEAAPLPASAVLQKIAEDQEQKKQSAVLKKEEAFQARPLPPQKTPEVSPGEQAKRAQLHLRDRLRKDAEAFAEEQARGERLRERLRKDAEAFAKEQERGEELRHRLRKDAEAFVEEQERGEQLRRRLRKDATSYFQLYSAADRAADPKAATPPCENGSSDVDALRAKLRTAAERFYSQAAEQEAYPAVVSAPGEESYLAAQVELLATELRPKQDPAPGPMQKRAWRQKREELLKRLSSSTEVRPEVKEALLERLEALWEQLGTPKSSEASN